MKLFPLNPAASILAGLLLGAGLAQIAWLSFSSNSQTATAGPAAGPHSLHPGTGAGNAVAALHGKDSFQELGSKAAHGDPQAAWLEALAMTNLAERTAFIDGLLRELAKTEPLKAMELAATLPAGSSQRDAFGAASAGWAAVDPAGASKWATTNLHGQLAADAFTAITREWADNNPAAAAAWISSLPNGVLSAGATEALVGIWANKDPGEASKWIDSLDSGDRKTGAMETLAAAWCAQSVDDAVKWVDQQIHKPGGGEVAQALIGAWGNQDPQAASLWVGKLTGDTQALTAGTLTALWAAHDPKTAAEWAASMGPGEARAQAIQSTATTWASIDPQNAIAWTRALPDSPEKKSAYNNAVLTWAAVSPTDITSWVNSQPAGADADHIRSVASTVLVESQPLDAISMTRQIADPTRSQAALVRVLNRWGQFDPAALQGWLATANLNPDVASRLKYVPEPKP